MRRSRTCPTAGDAPGAGGPESARVDSSRRSRATVRWAAVSLVAALSLSACSSRPSPAVHPSTPGPGASQSAPASPTPDTPAPAPSPPLAVHIEVTGGPEAATLTATATPADGATPASDGDSGLVLTATLPAADDAADDGAPLARLTVVAAAGSTVTVAPDDTGAVVTSAGDLVVGLAAPLVVDAAGTSLAASWQVPEAASGAGTEDPSADGAATSSLTDSLTSSLTVDLVLDAAVVPGAGPLTVTVHLGTTVVASTEWGTREGGESLAVTPSAWGRVSGQTGYALGWADVVRLEPTAETSVMEKQFRCHQLGAPDKATWNLEPWRPDVSYLAYVAARCNPT